MFNFNRGDRVMSNVMGHYYGMPGTIINKALVQHNADTRFSIELDIGKIITLKQSQIRHCDDD